MALYTLASEPEITLSHPTPASNRATMQYISSGALFSMTTTDPGNG